MSLIKLCSLVFLVSLCGVNAQMDTTFCNPDDIVADPGNVEIPLPDIYDQFEQLIEFNANGFTEEIVEIYDGIRNVGVTGRKNASNQVVYYANYDHDELFEFRENYQCRVMKLEEADPSILPFIPIKLPNGTLHLVFTLTALIASGQLKLVYIGSNQDIRGIPVNEWQGCLYTPGDQATSRITLSYSDPKKYTPAVFAEDWKSIPVQTLIETKRKNSESLEIALGSVTRYRPYIDVKSSTYNEYITPSGYFCPGRKNLKQFPDIPRAFSVMNQIAQPAPNTQDFRGYVTNWQEEYDYNNKLFRYDTVNISEVHDFSTGLNYFLNKKTGVCTIETLNIGIDSQTTTVDGATVVEMRNPAAFFGLEGSEYQYIGVKIQNGVACDVWIGKNKDSDVVLEWYFMTDSWSSPFQSGQTTGFPVLTIIYTPTINPIDQKPVTAMTFNHWFLFSDNLVNILEFEIERCNRGIDRQGFIFTLPINQAQIIKEHQGAFVQATILALQKVARVVILRIAHFAMDIAQDHIFITFAVFDRSTKYGNVVTPTDDVILEDAIKNLQDYFKKQPLQITFPIGSGKFQTVYSDQTLKTIHTTNDGYLQLDIQEIDQGFDSGAVALMVIMMIIIGITTGFLLIILHKSKKITLPFLRLFYQD